MGTTTLFAHLGGVFRLPRYRVVTGLKDVPWENRRGRIVGRGDYAASKTR